MERYEALELQVIAFEVDDVLNQGRVGVAGGGSGQAIAGGQGVNPVGN